MLISKWERRYHYRIYKYQKDNKETLWQLFAYNYNNLDDIDKSLERQPPITIQEETDNQDSINKLNFLKLENLSAKKTAEPDKLQWQILHINFTQIPSRDMKRNIYIVRLTFTLSNQTNVSTRKENHRLFPMNTDAEENFKQNNVNKLNPKIYV